MSPSTSSFFGQKDWGGRGHLIFYISLFSKLPLPIYRSSVCVHEGSYLKQNLLVLNVVLPVYATHLRGHGLEAYIKL